MSDQPPASSSDARRTATYQPDAPTHTQVPAPAPDTRSDGIPSAERTTPAPADYKPPHAPDELPDWPVERYTLLRRLGVGGMGEVFLATDRTLERSVAIKRPRFDPADPRAGELRARLIREARAAAAVHHPRLCEVYDVVDDQPAVGLFVAMRYVDGPDLAAHLKAAGRLPPRRAAAVVRAVAEGLAHLHEKGLIHRDLKPGNILMEGGTDPVVTDFGLTRAEVGPAEFDGPATADATEVLTRAGSIAGTPGYMAPEQFDPATPPDRRADVYALGVILYELLAGRRPFVADTIPQLIEQVRTAATPPLPKPIPPRLAAVAYRALEKTPADRFQAMSEFIAALDDIYSAAPPRRPVVWAGVAGAVLAAGLGMGLVFAPPAERVLVPASAADPPPAPRTFAELPDPLPPAEVPVCAESGRLPFKAADIPCLAAPPMLCESNCLLKVVTAGADGFIHVWNYVSIEEQHKLLVGDDRVLATTYARDNHLWAVARRTGVVVYSTAAVKLWAAPAPARAVGFSPDSTRLVAAGPAADDRPLIATVYNLSGLNPNSAVSLADTGDLVAPRGCGFLGSDGSRVLVVTAAGVVGVWDTATGRPVGRTTAPSPVTAIAVARDGSRFLTVGADGQVLVWKSGSGVPEQVRSLAGHRGRVNAVCLCQDTLTAVTAGEDGTARVWDTDNGIELGRFTGHACPVVDVVLTWDARFGISAGADGTVIRWDIPYPTDIYHPRTVRRTGNHQFLDGRHLSVSPDERVALVVGGEGHASVWNLPELTLRRTLPRQPGLVQAAAILPSGNLGVTGGHDGGFKDWRLRLWNLDTGQVARTLSGPTADTTSVAALVDRRTVIGTSQDGRLRAWDATDGRSLYEKVFNRPVKAAVSDPSGRRLLVATDDTSIHVLTAADGSHERTIVVPPGTSGQPTWVNDDVVLVPRQNGVAVLVELSSGGVRPLVGHVSDVRSTAVLPGGRHVVTGGNDLTVRVWDTQSGREVYRFAPQVGMVVSMRAAADGRHVLVTGRYLPLAVLRLPELPLPDPPTPFRQPTAKPIPPAVAAPPPTKADIVRTFRGHTEAVHNVAVSADGRTAVSVSADSTGIVWDVPTGAVRHLLTGHPNPLWAVATSRDVKTVLTGGQDHRKGITNGQRDHLVRVWDADTGRLRQTMSGPESTVSGIQFTSDESAVWVSSWDRALRRYPLARDIGRASQRRMPQPLSALAVHPDGVRVAVGMANGTVTVLAPGFPMRPIEFTPFRAIVDNLVWADADTLLTAGLDPSPVVTHLPTKRTVRLMGHVGPAQAIDAVPGGKYIVTGGTDATLRVWTMDGKPVAVVPSECGSVRAIKAMPDGRHALLAGADKTLRLHRLPLPN